MKTSINKPEIFKYVIALTARAGKAGGNYPDIAATEDNEAVLDLYLTAAVNEAEGELRRKIKDSNDISCWNNFKVSSPMPLAVYTLLPLRTLQP